MSKSKTLLYTSTSEFKTLTEREKRRAKPACRECLTDEPARRMCCALCQDVYFCSTACCDKSNHKTTCSRSAVKDDTMFLDLINVEHAVDRVVSVWKEKKLGVGVFMIVADKDVVMSNVDTQLLWLVKDTPSFNKIIASFKDVADDLQAWCDNPTKEFNLYIIFFDTTTAGARYVKQELILPEDFVWPPKTV